MDLNAKITTNYKELLRISYLITSNKPDAVELISEVYLKLLEKKTITPENNLEFIKFFSKCLKNRFLDKKRAKKIEFTTNGPLEKEDETEPTKYEGLLPKVVGFRNELTGLDKVLFELVYIQRLSYKKISYLYFQKNKHVLTVQSIYQLVKPLKQKIKIYKWKT